MSDKLYVLDVGHGNSAIAQADDWTLMVDAAPSVAVMETIEHLEIQRFDHIVISHRDADHARGVVPLIARRDLAIGTIFIAADAAKDPSAPDTALLLTSLADAKQSGRCRVSRDLDAALPAGELNGGDMAVEVLAPGYAIAMTGPKGASPAGGRITSNGSSAVLRITLPGGLEVLLPGDIDEVAFEDLRRRGVDLRADVLVFPHHGSQRTVDDEQAFASDLIRAVDPTTVLFSTGRAARVRPSPDTLRGIFEVKPDVEIACTQLSSGCLPSEAALPGGKGARSHLSDVPAAGAPRCASCAGSLTLAGSGVIAPAREMHQAYINSTASRPMCRLLRMAHETEPS